MAEPRQIAPHLRSQFRTDIEPPLPTKAVLAHPAAEKYIYLLVGLQLTFVMVKAFEQTVSEGATVIGVPLRVLFHTIFNAPSVGQPDAV